MLVFVKEKLVIIDVPKCATTSINSALRSQASIVIGGSPNLKHLKFQESFNFLQVLFSGKFNIKEFQFVSLYRNPVDWMYSWYCYRSRTDLQNPLHPNHLNRIPEGTSFENFCQTYLDDGERQKFHPHHNQFDFVSDVNGRLGIDNCFSFNSLGFFESWLSDRLKKKVIFPKKNYSRSRGGSDLSSDTFDSFRSKYPKDFRLAEMLTIKPVVLKSEFNMEETINPTSSFKG